MIITRVSGAKEAYDYNKVSPKLKTHSNHAAMCPLKGRTVIYIVNLALMLNVCGISTYHLFFKEILSKE